MIATYENRMLSDTCALMYIFLLLKGNLRIDR